MPAKLDTLPWLVLSRICHYLDVDDDDDDVIHESCRRGDLRAFSLTSRECCAASASNRFRQLRMTVTNGDDLMHALQRCAEMLDRDGGRYGCVQRLKIDTPEPVRVRADDEWDGRRSSPGRSDLPRFCRPRDGSGQGIPSKLQSATGNTDEPWLALACFIRRLPALKDLVWGFRNMPPPVLAAVHAAGACRLHMHRFWLDSLVVRRNGHPQVVDIDPDDYALATSPALHSVVARVRHYEDTGELNYGPEAIMGMAAGAAPNLQHVWMLDSMPSPTLDLRQALILGRPPAPPDHLFSPDFQGGSPRSLRFDTRPERINDWAARADLSKLSHLVLWWDRKWAHIAARGELVSLRYLSLGWLSAYACASVRRLLTALNPHSLQSLSMSGNISEALLDTVLDQHGKSLRSLSLLPSSSDYDGYEDDDNLTAPTFALTPALSTRIADKCPTLELLELSMNRTRGDANECGIYRALGTLPRLRRLSLTLHLTIDISSEALEDGEFYGHAAEIPLADLSRSFAHTAMDAHLARDIFHLISPPGSSIGLQHLKLETKHTLAWHARSSNAYSDPRFFALLRWFARSWICERRESAGGGGDGTPTPPPVVEVREHEAHATAEVGKAWQALAEAEKHCDGEEVFIQAFGEVWPQTTTRWWEDWTSLPLCLDGVPVGGR